MTVGFGEAIGRALVGGLTMGLIGPLGAGKTLLTRGIAIGNGIADSTSVTSPTFTLIQEYRGRLTLFHLDLYRLTKPAELAALGFDELIRNDSVVLVEWADKWPDALPSERVTITIEPSGASSRRFVIHASGHEGQQFFERLSSALEAVER